MAACRPFRLRSRPRCGMKLVARAFDASDEATMAYIEAGLEQSTGAPVAKVKAILKRADEAFDRETQFRLDLELSCGLKPPPDFHYDETRRCRRDLRPRAAFASRARGRHRDRQQRVPVLRHAPSARSRQRKPSPVRESTQSRVEAARLRSRAQLNEGISCGAPSAPTAHPGFAAWAIGREPAPYEP